MTDLIGPKLFELKSYLQRQPEHAGIEILAIVTAEGIHLEAFTRAGIRSVRVVPWIVIETSIDDQTLCREADKVQNVVMQKRIRYKT